MDINNELQQINTFVKGMNTDVSDALMDSSQYRYAENVRLATNTEENTGELRLIEGTKQFPYSRGNIKAMTSIRNILIVVTTDNKIWKKDTSNPENVFSLVFEPEEGDEFGDNLSLVTRWESANNVKLYIADGGSLMSLNIQDEYLIKGRDNISSIVDQVLTPIQTSIYSDAGHFTGVKFLYAYRLYNMGSAATTVSPLSSPIVIYTTEGGLDTSIADVNKSIQLTISNLSDTLYDYIQIFRISYISISTNPTVDIIYDGKVISGFIDSGGSIKEIAYEEFKNYSTFVIYPTLIESKEDRLFAANITDGQLNIDNTFEGVDMRALSTGDELSNNDYNILFNVNNILNYNESYWHKTSSYMANHPDADPIGGAGDYISWEYSIKYIYVDEKNRKYNNLSQAISETGVDELFQSLRPGEVYRYGAVLYDTKGVHSSVKWIADIMIPYDERRIPERIGITQTGLPIYKFAVYGVQFTINWDKVQQACGNKCSLIEIVKRERAHDDRITITQGIGGYPLLMYEPGGNTPQALICSPGILSTNQIPVTAIKEEEASVVIDDEEISLSNPQFLMFSSPEYVYNSEDMQNILDKSKSNITISSDYSIHSPIGSIQIGENHDTYYRLQSPEAEFDYGVPYMKVKLTNNTVGLIQDIKYKTFGNNTPSYDTLLWTAYRLHDLDYAFTVDDQRLFANPNTDNNVKVFMSHPYMYISSENVYGENNKVKNIGYAVSPKFDELINENNFVPSQYTFSVGDTSYLGWSVPLLPLYSTYIDQDIQNGDLNDDRHLYVKYPIGSTGKCIIILQQNASSLCNMENTSNISSNYLDFIKFPVLSLRSNNRTPYNGRQSVDYSVYQSFGYSIQASDDNPKVIYDGDCYPGVFVYNASHTWNEANCSKGIGQCNVYCVPLYSDIDLSATFGDLFTRITSNKKYFLLDYAGKVSNNYEQAKDAYLYNSAYNDHSSATTYSAISYTTLDNSLYDTRVFYSALKNNNEHVDNWLSFLELDFLDVDSRFGQITNMRLFKDKLLFWQEHASGVLSVNERTVLNDTDGNDIIVGSGGVLSRFDYISTIYGMKPHQFEAETQSNSTQYWWDGYNKEILAYAGGLELVPLTKVKGLTNYINLNAETKHPMLAYDIKYDELLSLVVGEYTIVYNEQIQAFSSIYTFMPQYRATTGNILYLAKTDKLYTWNDLALDNYSLLFNVPAFPKVKVIVNKNNIYTKTFDNLTFGGRMYKGSLPTITEWPMERGNGEYVEGEHLNAPMHHLIFTFETPLKLKSAVRGDKATSVDEYDYRLAIPRNGSQDSEIQYGNRMRGKTMQCEIASDYNSTDFSLQYITTKFRMSWS